MSVPPTRPGRTRRFRPDRDVEEWHGRYVPYDIVKEFTAAFLVVLLLTLGLAIVLSSPDVPPVTIKSWSQHAPLDFARTAVTELAGTSPTATYGPPYNSTPGASQSIGPLSLESIMGVHHPINTALDDVIAPLKTLPSDPALSDGDQAVHGCFGQDRTGMDECLRRRARARPVRRREADHPTRELRAGRRDDRCADDDGPQWCPRRRARELEAVLRDRLHEAFAVHRRRHVHGEPRRRAASPGIPVGDDERDRELPRSIVALVVHALVSGPAVHHLDECRRAPVWAIMVVLTVLLTLVPFLPVSAPFRARFASIG